MPSASPTSSVLVGAVGSPGDRIQLAPLLRGGGGHGHSSHAGSSTSPVLGHSSMSSSSSTGSSSAGGNASGGAGYSMIQLRSGSRPEYSPTGGSREREGRDDQRRERDLRDDVRGGGSGKKNPLSIGSIISEDGR